jgi:hypothetical protein
MTKTNPFGILVELTVNGSDVALVYEDERGSATSAILWETINVQPGWESNMRKFFILLTVTAWVGTAAAQAPFKSYTSPDSKFSVSFPGTPNVSASIQQQTDDGNTFSERHYAVSDDAAYILITADYSFATDNSALQSIAKEQATSCGAPPATIRSSNNIQGRSALLFAVDCPKTEKHAAISLLVQAVADGNRIYRLMYGTSDKPVDDRIFKFLASFHIN